MQSFTQEDLVQYLYDETSAEKSAALKAALETDWILSEKYESLVLAINSLENISLSPRQAAIDNILNYAERSVTAVSTEV